MHKRTRFKFDKKVFIIAEAGVNHNGSLMLAKRLVEAAKGSGADAIKFQTFRAKDIVTRNAPKARYQKIVSCKTQFEMLKKLELSQREFSQLFDYCRKKKIIFLSTPFDIGSAEFLNILGVCYFKIGSGDLTNIPLLIKIARYMKPILLSTGMSSLDEIKEAVEAIYSKGNRKLALLHCTSSYPAKFEDVNLKAIITLRKAFNVPVGYSDHTLGSSVAIAACALGARIIEKHLTLNRTMRGPDHSASLEPHEFEMLVRSIRELESAMGNGTKKVLPSEIEIQKIARKSIVAACHIPKGIMITEAMLTMKRPGTGIAPKYLNRIINKISKEHIRKDEVLTWKHVCS